MQSETVSINYSEESKQTIKELFLLMKATWGNKYTSNFKSPEDVRLAMRVWLQVFHNKDKCILRQALEQLALRLEWPPTIHEMSDQIKTIEKDQMALTNSYPRLPPSRRTDTGRRELNKLKKILST